MVSFVAELGLCSARRISISIQICLPDQCTSNKELGQFLRVCNLPAIHPEIKIVN